MKRSPKLARAHLGKQLQHYHTLHDDIQNTIIWSKWPRFRSNFSEVFKARDKTSSKFVAMKKVLMDNEKEGVSWIRRYTLFSWRVIGLALKLCFKLLVSHYGATWNPNLTIAETRKRCQSNWNLPNKGNGQQSLSVHILFGFWILRTRFGRFTVEHQR